VRIVVVQRLAYDVQIPPLLDLRSGRVKPEWQVSEINPPDARALDLGLQLKRAHPGTQVTLLHVGPPEIEPWLREGLARGCDGALRIWEEELAPSREAEDAVVLAGAAGSCGYDLILLGGSHAGETGAQTAQLLAAELGVPCLEAALELRPAAETAWLEVTRALMGGFTERLEVRLPAVVAVGGAGGEERAPLASLLSAQSEAVTVWDLADIGLPWERVRQAGRALRYGRLDRPRPGLRRVPAPDSSLPAFERIQQLLQGTTKRRKGRLIRGTGEELAEEVFQALLSEGWLDHLRPVSGEQAAPEGQG
jgi:electron transfer flavoprotein beta subunit